jgi:hypothetical protein
MVSDFWAFYLKQAVLFLKSHLWQQWYIRTEKMRIIAGEKKRVPAITLHNFRVPSAKKSFRTTVLDPKPDPVVCSWHIHYLYKINSNISSHLRPPVPQVISIDATSQCPHTLPWGLVTPSLTWGMLRVLAASRDPGDMTRHRYLWLNAIGCSCHMTTTWATYWPGSDESQRNLRVATFRRV